MNKTDPCWNDTRVIPSCGNVFIGLGFDPAEAEVMGLRVEVMIRLEQHLKAQVLVPVLKALRAELGEARANQLVTVSRSGVELMAMGHRSVVFTLRLCLAWRASYEKEIRFGVLVQLIADALLEHQGSGRKSFERGRETGC